MPKIGLYFTKILKREDITELWYTSHDYSNLYDAPGISWNINIPYNELSPDEQQEIDDYFSSVEFEFTSQGKLVRSDFESNTRIAGLAVELDVLFSIYDNFSGFMSLSTKARLNPRGVISRIGLRYNLTKAKQNRKNSEV